MKATPSMRSNLQKWKEMFAGESLADTALNKLAPNKHQLKNIKLPSFNKYAVTLSSQNTSFGKLQLFKSNSRYA